jgi:hypothetical protein
MLASAARYSVHKLVGRTIALDLCVTHACITVSCYDSTATGAKTNMNSSTQIKHTCRIADLGCTLDRHSSSWRRFDKAAPENIQGHRRRNRM